MGKGLWAAGVGLSGIWQPLAAHAVAGGCLSCPGRPAGEGKLLLSASLRLPTSRAATVLPTSCRVLGQIKRPLPLVLECVCLLLPRHGSPGTLWRPNVHPRGLGSIGRHWAGGGGVVAALCSRGRSRYRLATGQGCGRSLSRGRSQDPYCEMNPLPRLLPRTLC